eukprot:TRINITY_DN6875_c0_g2_i2.p1 TRINITY_DN6875_c0_g2~~TRINITY_DN6875_c0_g2_i2.p1  ORF type:complete len:213 (-),score=-13.67 TRINITY_DN6875_c0_g2_i2:22-567(-)
MDSICIRQLFIHEESSYVFQIWRVDFQILVSKNQHYIYVYICVCKFFIRLITIFEIRYTNVKRVIFLVGSIVIWLFSLLYQYLFLVFVLKCFTLPCFKIELIFESSKQNIECIRQLCLNYKLEYCQKSNDLLFSSSSCVDLTIQLNIYLLQFCTKVWVWFLFFVLNRYIDVDIITKLQIDL